MIRYNLNKLIAERGLSANKIYVDTGISRSTLSKLINNQSNMIQLDTIDKLCQYLKVTPSNFLSYLPVDVEVQTLINHIDIFDDGSHYYSAKDFRVDLEVFIKLKNTMQDFTQDFVYRISNIKKEYPEKNIFNRMSDEPILDSIGNTKKMVYLVIINFDDVLKEAIKDITGGDYAFSVEIKDLILKSINNEIHQAGFKELFAYVDNYFKF